ncbi:hypothetical protein R7M47_11860 [Bacillus inaquosorum]|uniref:hypothetical protein n=1 Tax=Bacillus inaquosorum TaxID=483913 RepID=UPI0038999BC2
MNKFKTTVFIIIALVFVSYFGYSFVMSNIEKSNPMAVSKAKNYTLSEGEYKAGDDIKPGFYDIEALDDNMVYKSIKLTKNDKLVNQDIPDQSILIIEGKGNIKLSPAKSEKVAKQNDTYNIVHSGFYVVGKQIPAGKYEVSYITENNKKTTTKPFVQVLPEFRGTPKKSINLENDKSYSITLDKGNILEIKKTMFEEDNNIKIKLKLM